jgi:hypothetical protein
MLRAPDTLQVLIVEPVDIRMRIPRVPRSAIDLAPVHGPEVRDDVNVCFRDVRRNVCVDESGDQKGFHYAC